MAGASEKASRLHPEKQVGVIQLRWGWEGCVVGKGAWEGGQGWP